MSSAALRSLIPASFLLTVGFALGVHWPGLGGLLLALLLVMGMGTVAACWGCALALKFRSQAAAPLMQAGMFVLILTTTAYAPIAYLSGWLHTVAQVNPAEKAELLSASISIAMNNTAFALMVAIPFLLIHAFLQAKTSEIVDGLEAAKISFLNLVQRLKAESSAAR